MNTIEVLKKARELLADRKNWTTGAYARSGRGGDGMVGVQVNSAAPNAVCWCSVGALSKVTTTIDELGECMHVTDDAWIAKNKAYRLLTEEANNRGYASVENFNDHNLHHEVLDLFDTVIARLGG